MRSLGMILLFACISTTAFAAELVQVDALCFTPGDDCTAVVVGQIGRAKHQILVQAYSFTDPDIAGALVDAKERGVEVRAILDKSQPGAKGGLIDKLAEADTHLQFPEVSPL